MKKTLSLFLALGMSVLSISSAHASETIYHYGDGTSGTTPPTQAQSAVGGFAVVNPETGAVLGVITGSTQYFGGNNQTMGSEYMGCSAGCLIVQQSTASQNGNVVGVAGPNITYNQDRNVFQSVAPGDTQIQTILEYSSNTVSIETDLTVTSSAKAYEFGVLDYAGNNFNFTEVAPPQNTSAQIAANTKQYSCVDREMACSRNLSNNSQTLVDESVLFSERSTSSQVLEKVITEAKNKVREQINLILLMLGKWIIN
jgi:hypothetical protein